MHTFGEFLNTCTGSNMIYGCVINSVFNMGVSIFALIAGYFGNNGSTDKMIKMWLTVIQYSLLSMAISIIGNYILGKDISLKIIINGFFPVFTRKYWFLSCYMVLMLLARPINLFVSFMERKQFKNFLLLSLFIFSFMPTMLLGYSITNDKGKGLVNFLLMFFIGRYLKRYYADLIMRKYLLGGGMECNSRN